MCISVLGGEKKEEVAIMQFYISIPGYARISSAVRD